MSAATVSHQDSAPAEPILILTAMPEEAAPFAHRAQEAGEKVPRLERGVVFSLPTHDAVVAVTGIGAVNAAVRCTQLVEQLQPRLVVSAGSAGGLGRDIRIGDVVVGQSYRYHMADATAFGYELGQIPGMPPAYPGAEQIIDAARTLAGDHRHAADGLGPAGELGAAGDGTAAPGSAPTIHCGEIVSGDSFIAAHLVEHVRTDFPDAIATDMETTALAQACWLLNVPFVSVRSISDLCQADASDSFQLSLAQVADRSAATALSLVQYAGI